MKALFYCTCTLFCPICYLNYFHDTIESGGKPLHIGLCILHAIYALVLHCFDVPLVLFIWTTEKNLCTFFFYIVNISFI